MSGSARCELAARLALAIAVAAALALRPECARADESNPHDMTKADGSLDSEACALCHTASMDLERSKLETCTLCHAETVHSGAAEHVRAQPEKVASALAGRPSGGVELPLADGRIWCGTCHLYHDPKVLSEEWLAHGWVPPDHGLPAAVREGVLARWARLAEVYDQHDTGKFASTGTRLLRLPVKDGTLCRQCHAAMAGAQK